MSVPCVRVCVLVNPVGIDRRPLNCRIAGVFGHDMDGQCRYEGEWGEGQC